MDAKAVLADVGDGDQEVFLQTEEVGDYALKWDGTTAWKQCWGGGNSDPVVDDLDGDGHPEAIFAADDGFLSVFDAATGTPRWTFDPAKPLGGAPPPIPLAPPRPSPPPSGWGAPPPPSPWPPPSPTSTATCPRRSSSRRATPPATAPSRTTGTTTSPSWPSKLGR